MSAIMLALRVFADVAPVLVIVYALTVSSRGK
jgi:hypothetical protein